MLQIISAGWGQAVELAQARKVAHEKGLTSILTTSLREFGIQMRDM
jgi:hypothetical protein